VDNQAPEAAGLWDQRKWLSDADLRAGFVAAVTAPASLRSAVVTLVSDNAGMAWDEPRRVCRRPVSLGQAASGTSSGSRT
jgi:hypothetical protein